MRGFGGMVSFNFVSVKEDAIGLEKIKLFTRRIFRWVESLANYSVNDGTLDSGREKKVESPMI
jgi:hypothetical protein